MPEDPLDRLQDEVTEHGKDIRELQTWRDEVNRWRDTQAGMRGHMITWGLMLLAVVAEVMLHWGK